MATFSSPFDSIIPSNTDLIYSNVLTSPTNSVSTGTLPVGGYKAYRVYTSLRSTGAFINSVIEILFNGHVSNSTNYISAYAALKADNAIFIGLPNPRAMGPRINGANMTANQFAFGVLDIQNPEATDRRKMYIGQDYGPNNGTAIGANQIRTYGIMYNKTQAITSIEFKHANNFVSGCSFYIYGIK